MVPLPHSQVLRLGHLRWFGGATGQPPDTQHQNLIRGQNFLCCQDSVFNGSLKNNKHTSQHNHNWVKSAVMIYNDWLQSGAMTGSCLPLLANMTS